MYLLAHVPAARAILQRVQDHLTAQGQHHPTVTVPGHDDPQEFDLWTGLHVLDHGTKQPQLTCVLCPPGSGHHLRYEFRVTTVDGEVVGPVGSSCIFVRVLGEDAARSIGTDLTTQVRAHHARTQTLSQLALLEEAGNWREYLRRQGYDWVLTAMAGTTELPKDLREALDALQAKQKPLTPALRSRLQALTSERQARTASTSPDVSGTPGAPAAFQPVTPTLARPRATQGRRQAGAGNRMAIDDWEAYLRTNRLNVLVGHWEDIEPTLTLDDDTRAFLNETIQSRRPFRLDDLTLLQRLVKDAAIRAQLQTLGAPRTPMTLGRLPSVAPARHIDLETGLEVLDVGDDPVLRDARAWNRGLQAVLPDVVWQRLQHAFRDGRLRADDYAAVCRTLECRANPPPDPALRTLDRFLTLVALLLGQEMKFSRARDVRRPARQGEMVAHLGREWHRYEAGQQVNEREVVARALQPTRAEAEAEQAIRQRELARPPLSARTSGRVKGSADVTPVDASPQPKITAAATSAPNRPTRSGTAVPAHAPTVALPQAQRTALHAAWGRGLSHLIPPTYRRAASRAIHQGTGGLTSEQVQVLLAALTVFETKTVMAPPAFTVPADEPRTPVRYAAALHRLFGELGVPFLQVALAQKGYSWLHTTFPNAYQQYVDTGTLHQSLDELWVGLL